jgi:hypothetical protein
MLNFVIKPNYESYAMSLFQTDNIVAAGFHMLGIAFIEGPKAYGSDHCRAHVRTEGGTDFVRDLAHSIRGSNAHKIFMATC